MGGGGSERRPVHSGELPGTDEVLTQQLGSRKVFQRKHFSTENSAVPHIV